MVTLRSGSLSSCLPGVLAWPALSCLSGCALYAVPDHAWSGACCGADCTWLCYSMLVTHNAAAELASVAVATTLHAAHSESAACQELQNAQGVG